VAVCIWLCIVIVPWQYVFAVVMNAKADTYTEQQKKKVFEIRASVLYVRIHI